MENIRKADEMGIPMIVRTPIVASVNDSEENIKLTAFLHSLKNVIKYELLSYHPLGAEKARALEIEYAEFDVPSKQHM